MKALPGGGMLSSKEITLPVEDPKAAAAVRRWYTRAVVDEDTGKIVRPGGVGRRGVRGSRRPSRSGGSRPGGRRGGFRVRLAVGTRSRRRGARATGGRGHQVCRRGGERRRIARVGRSGVGRRQGVGRGVGGIFSGPRKRRGSGVHKTVRQEGFGGGVQGARRGRERYKQRAAERGEAGKGDKGDKGETQATQVDALPPPTSQPRSSFASGSGTSPWTTRSRRRRATTTTNGTP